MPSRQGPIERGRARGQHLRTGLAREIRTARRQHDLSLEDAGRPAGMSAAKLSRIERGLVPSLDLEELAVVCAVVGLELSIRTYPAGEPLRDRAHLALLGRFRALVHPSVAWRAEAALPIPGDLRAWDALLAVGGRRLGVEAETRPDDLQALERRLALKMRDGGVEAVILLLADTRHNRRLVRLHADDLARTFPVPGRRALERLAAAVHPDGSSIVLL